MRTIDRTHKGYFEFRPVDNAAKDGAYHLLRDNVGHQHSGFWDGQRFVYASGATIVPPIVEYCARRQEAA